MSILPDLVVMDLETTGLDLLRHEILEIGALRVTPHLATVKAEFSQKILPQHIDTADPVALKTNGYTPVRWKEAQPAKRVLELFVRFSNGAMLAGFNVAIDWAFLHTAFDREDIVDLNAGLPFDYHLFDVFSVSYEAIRKDPKLASWNLRSLCDLYGVSRPPDPHQALEDAKATLELLKAVRKRPG